MAIPATGHEPDTPMARKLHSTIETRTNRLKLPPRGKPYGWTAIAPGARLGYRRNKRGAGTWVVAVADGKGGEKQKPVGLADDFEDAAGEHSLTFWQAVEHGRQRRAVNPATTARRLSPWRSTLIGVT